MISDLQLVIKGGLPKSMRGELDDHPEDYRSLTYEDRCDLLSKIEVKDESKRAAVHIKKISYARAAYISISVTNTRGFRGGRRPRLVSCALTNPPKGRTAGTMGYISYCVICKYCQGLHWHAHQTPHQG